MENETLLMTGESDELSFEFIKSHSESLKSKRIEDAIFEIEMSKKDAGKLLATTWEYFLCSLSLKKWENVKAIKRDR